MRARRRSLANRPIDATPCREELPDLLRRPLGRCPSEAHEARAHRRDEVGDGPLAQLHFRADYIGSLATIARHRLARRRKLRGQPRESTLLAPRPIRRVVDRGCDDVTESCLSGLDALPHRSQGLDPRSGGHDRSPKLVVGHLDSRRELTRRVVRQEASARHLSHVNAERGHRRGLARRERRRLRGSRAGRSIHRCSRRPCADTLLPLSSPHEVNVTPRGGKNRRISRAAERAHATRFVEGVCASAHHGRSGPRR